MAINISVRRGRIDEHAAIDLRGAGYVPRVHRELGYLYGTVDFATHTVTHTFDAEFQSSTPYHDVEVYRMVQRDGYWFKKDVWHKYNAEAWFDETGFEIEIEASEALSGIIVKYFFTE